MSLQAVLMMAIITTQHTLTEQELLLYLRAYNSESYIGYC